MGVWNNLKKTYYYSRKNGVKNACYAAAERVLSPYYKNYEYIPITDEEEANQRRKEWSNKPLFSIIVPAYRTDEKYMKELIESVLGQTYSNLELIIADAGGEVSVEEIVKAYGDERIRYIALENNLGISENTNAAIKVAAGDYIGLLDHDDLLTKDALFEMALKIEEEQGKNKKLMLLYSDEDKCDETTEHFYEPHYKTELNLDLILSNNYICHFTVAKRELFQELLLRPEYDGAQDYDFVLRCLLQLWEQQELICHVPKVLYHWRCHSASTAANPQSKMYAYEAGKRALQDFVERMGWSGKVSHSEHLGYYRIDYQPDIFTNRKAVGVIGGRVISKGKISGVILSKQGEALYKGMPSRYAGYMNRVTLPREVGAVDLRNIQITPELEDLYEKVVGVPYAEGYKGVQKLLSREMIEERSIQFCKEVKNAGYKVLYYPLLPDRKI